MFSFKSNPIQNLSFQIFRKFSNPKWRNTTILAVKKDKKITLIADGQCTLGDTIVKTNSIKLKKLPGNAFCGFAGSVADAFILLEGLEKTMNRYPQQTLNSCLKYASEWRTGKALRHLQASLIVCDHDIIIEMDGTGTVVDITDGVIGIGSGGLFAECAARALLDIQGLDSEEIARRAMNIAAKKCIYTSNEFIHHNLEWE